MASKRTRTDCGGNSQDDLEDFIKKTPCIAIEPDIEKSQSVFFQLLPLRPGEPVKIEPTASSSQSCVEPSGSVAVVPSNSKLAASLTSELNIKEEEINEDEDFKISDSKSDVKEESIDEEQDFDSDEQYEKKGEDANNIKKLVWTKNSNSMKSFLFTKEQKMLVPIPREPYDILRMFLDDEILDLIVNETNINASKWEKSWEPVTRSELTTFIGLLIHTGTISLHRLSDYWNNHYLFFIKCFSRFMKRNRFLQLLDYLSFSSATGQFNLEKIQPIVDHFNKKMNEIYYPGVNLIVTKSIAIHCGNIVGYEQNRRRPAVSNRITETHILIEPTGIVLKLNVTLGNVSDDSVVIDLVSEKLDNGHSVYLAKDYNKFPTPLILLGRNTYCTGLLDNHIVQSIQPSNTPGTLYNLYKKTDSYFCDGIHLFKRNDHFYVSTQYDEESVHVPNSRGGVSNKSKLVAMYESVMALDLYESLMKYYPCRENSLSWHKKVFIHIIQLALTNSYKLHGKSNRFYHFRLDVLEKMLPVNTVPTQTIPHALTKIEKVKMREKRARHGQISITKEVVRKECRGCRMEQRNKRTTTVFECRQCENSPGYCEPCFKRIHQDLNTNTANTKE